METAFECSVKGNFSGHGLSKIFLACHPEDASFCWPVTEDIQRISNCAVYFLKETAAVPDPELLVFELAAMSAIVLLVTDRFLRESFLLKRAVLDAVETWHIPIIPIKMEENIEELFCSQMDNLTGVRGDLQMLSYHSKDATEIPYDEKLTMTLRQILPSEEDYLQIRQTFSSRIFLSYRKKDRAYARTLMMRLHDIEGFYHFSIWYDELLSIGERWDEEILEQLRRSDIFLLLVTPSILEADNYCHTHEYPEAKAQGMEMIAVQMDRMDPEQLQVFREMYPDMGVPLNGADPNTLEAIFRKHLPHLEDAPNTRYYIGLAFLIGVNVEKNTELAVWLITSAAEDGLILAMERLADMYHSSIGTAIDHYRSALWRDKAAAALQKAFEEMPTDESSFHSCDAMVKLIHTWISIGEYEKAACAVRQLFDWINTLQEKAHSSIVFHYFATAVSLMGKISFAQRDFDQALFYSRENCRIHEALLQASDTETNRHNLSVAYESLGLLYFKLRKYDDAQMWYEKALNIRTELFQTRNDRDAASSIAHLHEGIGDLYLRKRDHRSAEDQFLSARKLLERLLHLDETISYRSRYANVTGMLGVVQVHKRQWTKARQYFAESLELNRRLADEVRTPESLRNLSIALNKMGLMESLKQNYSRSAGYYKESLALREQLHHTGQNPDAVFDTALVYYYLAEVTREGIRSEDAMGYYRKVVELLVPILPHDRTLDPHTICTKSLFEIFRFDTFRGEPFLRRAIAYAQWLTEMEPASKEYQKMYRQYTGIFRKCYPAGSLTEQ